MNINGYKKYYQRQKYNKEQLQNALDNVLIRIKFLENIYMSGGQFFGYSKNFSDAAYKEREELCQDSSALFSLLRNN